MTIAAIRYNNPGNVSLPIQGYNGPGTVVGIQGQSGYASFPTMADGLAAQQARITSYIDGSTRYGARTTIASLNGVYAEDPNWKNNVSRFSGIGVNEQLDPNNPQQMAALQGGIIRQETGRDPSVFGFTGSPANSNTPSGTSAPLNSDNPTGGTGASGLGNSSDQNAQPYTTNPDGSLNLPQQSVTTQQQSGGQVGQTAAGSMSVPQAIDAQTRGETTQSAQDTRSLNQQSQANTTSITGTANSIFNTVSGSLSDYFIRAIFVIVGLIALAAALMLFKPVQNAAVAVATKVPV